MWPEFLPRLQYLVGKGETVQQGHLACKQMKDLLKSYDEYRYPDGSLDNIQEYLQPYIDWFHQTHGQFIWEAPGWDWPPSTIPAPLPQPPTTRLNRGSTSRGHGRGDYGYGKNGRGGATSKHAPGEINSQMNSNNQQPQTNNN